MTVTTDVTRLFPGDGEAARLLRHTDWAQTPLGPVAGWPAALVNAVSLLLPASAEIVLFWGPDYIALYNDAYAPTIGSKHPRAFGRRAGESWAELWDDLEPLLRHVRETGETYSAKDRPFYIERAGMGEEVFFDISYSAVRLEDGSVGGVLCIVSETTERVRAANALYADRQRLRALFDSAPGFMAVLRMPGFVFEFANAAFDRLMGGRALIGLTAHEAVPEALAQGLMARLEEVADTGVAYNATRRSVVFATDDRVEEHVLDFVYQPIVGDAGKVEAIFIEGVDLTERFRAETALELSRETLQVATDAAEIGIWQVDLLRDELEWSDRTRQIYGIPPGERVELAAAMAAIHPDDVTGVMEALDKAIDPDARAIIDLEYRIRRRDDGAVRWLAVKGRGLFDGDRCVRALGTTIDVTRRREEAETLRESEARFRTLADSLPALVWLSDAIGRVVFANQGFARLLGRDPATVVRRGWDSLVHPDDLAPVRTRLAARSRDHRPDAGEIRVVTDAGATRWLHVELRPRFSGDNFVGHVACAIDVTRAHLAGEELEARIEERTSELMRQIDEREQVEAALHQMQRLEAIGQLTSGIAHDFNNLLTVVLGNVDVMIRSGAKAGFDARTLQRLEHVRGAAERGATLTQQLLAFSRRQRLETNVVDLNDTVRGMAGLLRSTLGRAIDIVTGLEVDPWPALVDPTQIELIILNLAINARDAMTDGGTLTVSTRNVTCAAPSRPEEPPAGDYVRVTVADTGTGMDAAVLARAFEPFFTTKEVGKGSGLGLAQVFGFAKQSGGGVSIDTQVGRGTTVNVFLPRAPRAPLPPASVAPEPASRSMQGRTALVLDDEDGVREITADTLREAGFRVIEAGDGASALRALSHEPAIDIVVADFAMPHMNGVEFARRARRRFPALPVLFVTGYADLETIADVPPQHVLRKPYAGATLVERVGALLPPVPPVRG